MMLGLQIRGQDLHFSQFYNNPLNLNPGLTGVFQADQRFAGSYRNQWRAVPVSYTTFSATYDQQMDWQKLKKGKLAAGLQFQYDQAGDGGLSLASFGMSGAYLFPLNEKHVISAGLQTQMVQRAFRPEHFTFGSQFNGDIFQEDLNSGENFNNASAFFFDWSGGVNWHIRPFGANKKRTWVDAGVGLFHFNQPMQRFAGAFESPFPSRLSWYALSSWQVSNNWDLLVHWMSQDQLKNNERLAGVAGQLYLNPKRDKELAVKIGVNYRFDRIADALIPTAGVLYRTWRLDVSYDVNVSGFDAATIRRGGPEVHLRYLITKLKPIPEFKICPII